MTLVYIYPINDILFIKAGGDLAPEKVRSMARQWISADRLRFGIMTIDCPCCDSRLTGAPVLTPESQRFRTVAKGRLSARSSEMKSNRYRHSRRSRRCRIAAPQPMPVAGPQLGDAVKQMLQSKGIGFHPLRALSAVETQSRTLRFQQGWVPGRF